MPRTENGQLLADHEIIWICPFTKSFLLKQQFPLELHMCFAIMPPFPFINFMSLGATIFPTDATPACAVTELTKELFPASAWFTKPHHYCCIGHFPSFRVLLNRVRRGQGVIGKVCVGEHDSIIVGSTRKGDAITNPIHLRKPY